MRVMLTLICIVENIQEKEKEKQEFLYWQNIGEDYGGATGNLLFFDNMGKKKWKKKKFSSFG